MTTGIIQKYVTTELHKRSWCSTYIASPIDEPQQNVILTVYSPNLFSSSSDRIETLQLFKNAQRLQHPAIVPLLSLDQDEDFIYTTRAYLPHGSLETRLNHLSQTVPAVLSMLFPLGQALSYMHQQEIFHGALSPEHVFFDDQEQLVLADIFPFAPNWSRFAGDLAGDLALFYMAPEQWTGSSNALTDQYALGCIAYTMLTGRTPFAAQDPIARLSLSVIEQLLPPAQNVPGIPDTIEAVILKALSTHPENRYRDITAFMDALSTVADSYLPPHLSTATEPATTAVDETVLQESAKSDLPMFEVAQAAEEQFPSAPFKDPKTLPDEISTGDEDQALDDAQWKRTTSESTDADVTDLSASPALLADEDAIEGWNEEDSLFPVLRDLSVEREESSEEDSLFPVLQSTAAIDAWEENDLQAPVVINLLDPLSEGSRPFTLTTEPLTTVTVVHVQEEGNDSPQIMFSKIDTTDMDALFNPFEPIDPLLDRQTLSSQSYPNAFAPSPILSGPAGGTNESAIIPLATSAPVFYGASGNFVQEKTRIRQLAYISIIALILVFVLFEVFHNNQVSKKATVPVSQQHTSVVNGRRASIDATATVVTQSLSNQPSPTEQQATATGIAKTNSSTPTNVVSGSKSVSTPVPVSRSNAPATTPTAKPRSTPTPATVPTTTPQPTPTPTTASTTTSQPAPAPAWTGPQGSGWNGGWGSGWTGPQGPGWGGPFR